MNILSRLVNLVYPSKCSFCGKLISFQKSGINICSECMDKIKFCASRKRCKVCGTRLETLVTASAKVVLEKLSQIYAPIIMVLLLLWNMTEIPKEEYLISNTPEA